MISLVTDGSDSDTIIAGICYDSIHLVWFCREESGNCFNFSRKIKGAEFVRVCKPPVTYCSIKRYPSTQPNSHHYKKGKKDTSTNGTIVPISSNRTRAI